MVLNALSYARESYSGYLLFFPLISLFFFSFNYIQVFF